MRIRLHWQLDGMPRAYQHASSWTSLSVGSCNFQSCLFLDAHIFLDHALCGDVSRRSPLTYSLFKSTITRLIVKLDSICSASASISARPSQKGPAQHVRMTIGAFPSSHSCDQYQAIIRLGNTTPLQNRHHSTRYTVKHATSYNNHKLLISASTHTVQQHLDIFKGHSNENEALI